MVSAFSYEYPPELTSPSERLAIGIGALVMEWANCETIFYGIFECIAGRAATDNGHVIWLSLRTTEARMALLVQLAKVQHGTDLNAEQIAKLCERFKGVSRVRNFFCHSDYPLDDDGDVIRVQNFSLVPLDEPIAWKAKPMTKGTLNELAHTIEQCRRLCVDAWKLLVNVRETLQVQHVELPQWLDEYLAEAARHQPRNTPKKRSSPPAPSRA